MSIFESRRRRAGLLVAVLGAVLLVALSPFATGLLAIPVLYTCFRPVHRWLVGRGLRPNAAALVVIALAMVVTLGPLASFLGLIVGEAQSIASGVVSSPLLAKLQSLRIGPYQLGDQVVELGGKVVSWIAGSAAGLIGSAGRAALNLTISLFGLYYLLQGSDVVWEAFRPYIPFSDENADVLRRRFADVTIATLIGTGLVAVIQGALVALAFAVTGLGNAVLWGLVTVVVSILPVVGSGLVWAPAAVVLWLDGQPGWAIGLAIWGVVVIGNVDTVLRPLVARRYANIHPLATLIGAFAGVPYLGLLGLFIGPLAVSYFFELLKMYRAEYLTSASPALVGSNEAA
ncbi:MAG: AI-2E family transporter [Gemmatimonadota bacterium]